MLKQLTKILSLINRVKVVIVLSGFLTLGGCASVPLFDLGGVPEMVSSGLASFSLNRSRRTSSKSRTGGSVYRGNHGLLVAQPNVSTRCLRPSLRSALHKIENRFHTKVVLTSGYRSPSKNKRAGGSRHSKHLSCEAADIYVPGVAKSKVIAYTRSLGMIGGVGCYPGRRFFHIDVRKRTKGRQTYFRGCPKAWSSTKKIGILWF